MDNLTSSFQSPDFQKLLKKYTEMLEQNKSVYFDSNDLTLLAEYFASQGNPEKAKQVIEYAKTLHPDNLDISIYECNNLLAQGEISKAAELLDSLTDQQDYEVRLLKANLLIEQHRQEEAEAIIRQLLEEENYSTDSLLDIAGIYLDSQQLPTAYQWIQKAYQQDPDNIEVLNSLVDYYQTKGDLQNAAECYKKILDEHPYDLNAWIDLTKCYLQLSEEEKAFEAVDFALAINEKSPEAMEMKGFCYMQQGSVEKALKYLLKANELYHGKPRLWIVIAQCYMSLMLYPIAEEYLTNLLKQPDIPNYEKVYYYEQRAFCYLARCQTEKCLSDLEAGMKCDPQFPRLYLTYGEYYLVKNDLKNAQIEFAHAEALEPHKDEMLGLIASTLLRYEYIDEAVQILKRIEEEFPDKLKEYYGYLAYVHFLKGDIRSMTNDIANGIRKAPKILYANIMSIGDHDDVFRDIAMNIYNNVNNSPDILQQENE